MPERQTSSVMSQYKSNRLPLLQSISTVLLLIFVILTALQHLNLVEVIKFTYVNETAENKTSSLRGVFGFNFGRTESSKKTTSDREEIKMPKIKQQRRNSLATNKSATTLPTKPKEQKLQSSKIEAPVKQVENKAPSASTSFLSSITKDDTTSKQNKPSIEDRSGFQPKKVLEDAAEVIKSIPQSSIDVEKVETKVQEAVKEAVKEKAVVEEAVKAAAATVVPPPAETAPPPPSKKPAQSSTFLQMMGITKKDEKWRKLCHISSAAHVDHITKQKKNTAATGTIHLNSLLGPRQYLSSCCPASTSASTSVDELGITLSDGGDEGGRHLVLLEGELQVRQGCDPEFDPEHVLTMEPEAAANKRAIMKDKTKVLQRLPQPKWGEIKRAPFDRRVTNRVLVINDEGELQLIEGKPVTDELTEHVDEKHLIDLQGGSISIVWSSNMRKWKVEDSTGAGAGAGGGAATAAETAANGATTSSFYTLEFRPEHEVSGEASPKPRLVMYRTVVLGRPDSKAVLSKEKVWAMPKGK